LLCGRERTERFDAGAKRQERRGSGGPQGEGAARVALLSHIYTTDLQQNPLFGAFSLSSAPAYGFDDAFSGVGFSFERTLAQARKPLNFFNKILNSVTCDRPACAFFATNAKSVDFLQKTLALSHIDH
jgi:hypothetical protein